MLNVQHDCFRARCAAAPPGKVRHERQKTDKEGRLVLHNWTGEYLLNSCAIRHHVKTRDYANYPAFSAVADMSDEEASQAGLSFWAEEAKEKSKQKAKSKDKDKSKAGLEGSDAASRPENEPAVIDNDKSDEDWTEDEGDISVPQSFNAYSLYN